MRNLVEQIIDAIDQGEIPLALAIELDAPGRLARAWRRANVDRVFDVLARVRPQAFRLRDGARLAALYSGINPTLAEHVLRGDPLPRGAGVEMLRVSMPSSWAWQLIRTARVQDRTLTTGDLYDMYQAGVPHEFVRDSMLQPQGIPTIAEIVAAAAHMRAENGER